MGQHFALAKIHKDCFDTEDGCLTEQHGNGVPLPHVADLLPFRLVNPLKHSPTAKLRKFCGKLLEPLQNSGLRTNSIQKIAENIQNDLKNNPMRENEVIVSFDAQKFYDNLSPDLLMRCIRSRWARVLEQGRDLSLEIFEKCVRLCFEDAVLFQGKFYTQKCGSPTGHPISSSAQNVIMSALEEEIIMPLIQEGKVSAFERWVDDTKVRLAVQDIEEVLARLNSFDPNLTFTCEKPTQVNIKGEIFNFLPFLDIGIYWNARTSVTKVYRKATASKIVMPFTEFGPFNWKKGTLIFFIRRAITHTSDQLLMHEELETLASQFKLCGYPARLVHSTINKTVTKVLYPEKVKSPKTTTNDPPERWSATYALVWR